MSVSSILALFVGAIAVKNRRADRQEEKRTAELEARIAELEDAIASANAQARRDQELIDIWRERALHAEAPIGALVPAGPDFRPPQIAQQQAAQMLAQAYAQQMNFQNAYQNQGLAQLGQQAPLGLLGAQTLIDRELWCNCVPARHDMFLRGE